MNLGEFAEFLGNPDRQVCDEVVVCVQAGEWDQRLQVVQAGETITRHVQVGQRGESVQPLQALDHIGSQAQAQQVGQIIQVFNELFRRQAVNIYLYEQVFWQLRKYGD